jgi:hypothetical protein
MTDFNISETWKTMWEGALPGPQARELTRQSARSHWDGQQRILNSLEDFANGWFERRETGVRAAAEAAYEMCGAPTFVEVFATWQKWAAGAAERLATDGMAWQQCLTACGAPLMAFVPREAEEPKAPAKVTKSAARELPKAA